MAKKSSKLAMSDSNIRPVTLSNTEARRLIVMIEKSQVPFGESAPVFARIKGEVEGGKQLSAEEYQHLLDLVKKAKDWEKAVASSAMTEPEETLPG